jgi:dCTP deaminase
MTNETQGILPDGAIRRLIAAGHVRLAEPQAERQIQPASLDLRLGAKAYRVRASFLPGPNSSVADKLADVALHEFDLTQGAVLETGCVYIVPLLESLGLPAGIAASANPKSSTGRLDVFTRVITDRARAFDQIAEGYSGPLFLEVSPRTFPVVVRQGSRTVADPLPARPSAARRRSTGRTPPARYAGERPGALHRRAGAVHRLAR